MNRIMLAVPSGATWQALTGSDVVTAAVGSQGSVCGIMAMQGSFLSLTHNKIVERTIEYNDSNPMTHIMFVDADQRLPHDTIPRLLAHGKAIAGAGYRRRGVPHDMMVGMLGTGNEDVWEVPLDHTGLEEVRWLPSGILLVSMAVFQKVRYPWFYETYGKTSKDFRGTDTNFCKKARQHGFPTFIDWDLSREIRHIADIELSFDGAFVAMNP